MMHGADQRPVAIRASLANATSVEAKIYPVLPGGNSEREPPDPIPNSEVKTFCADGSVAASHARVGHCQAPHAKAPMLIRVSGPFFVCERDSSRLHRSIASRPVIPAAQRRSYVLTAVGRVNTMAACAMVAESGLILARPLPHRTARGDRAQHEPDRCQCGLYPNR